MKISELHLCHLCPRRFTRRANLDAHLVKCEKRKSAAKVPCNQQLVNMQRQASKSVFIIKIQIHREQKDLPAVVVAHHFYL